MDSGSPSRACGVNGQGGRVLFESDLKVAAGIETTVRHCTEASVSEEFPDRPSLSQDAAWRPPSWWPTRQTGGQ